VSLETISWAPIPFASLNDYVAGRPQTFTQASGNPLLDAHQLRFQCVRSDGLARGENVNVGFGGRYIAQSNLPTTATSPTLVSFWAPPLLKVPLTFTAIAWVTEAVSLSVSIAWNRSSFTIFPLGIARSLNWTCQTRPDVVKARSGRLKPRFLDSSRRS